MNNKWIFGGIIVVLLILALTRFMGNNPNQTTDTSQVPSRTIQPTTNAVSMTPSAVTSTVTVEEKSQIDAWIEKKNLNFYADPKDSAYAGGTPLFDESTGSYIDRYEYILKNHPDQPWKN
jgi:hypothetical protein